MNAEAVEVLQRALDQERQAESVTERLRRLRFTVPEGAPTAAELIRMDRDDPEHGRIRR